MTEWILSSSILILIVIGVIIVLVSALQKMSDKISEKKTDGGAQ